MSEVLAPWIPQSPEGPSVWTNLPLLGKFRSGIRKARHLEPLPDNQGAAAPDLILLPWCAGGVVAAARLFRASGAEREAWGAAPLVRACV